MGFFTKLKNFFTKGKWAETEELETPVETLEQKRQELEKAEEKQYKEEPKRIEVQEEQPKDKKPIGIRVPDKTTKKETTEIEKAVKQYGKVPTVSSIEKGINPEGQNKINVSQNQLGEMGQLRPQYTQIFSENAKLTDPDILEVLFKGRQQLQHRFTAIITVFIDGKTANALEVVGILIEHTGMTHNYITAGMQIDSAPQLDMMLEELGNAFKSNFGAIEATLKGKNTYKGSITSVDIDVTFA